ncbi:phospholipid scramblase 3-like [Bufo gargarizans]|uniref:phospholipid scramblase 3-like n=1 Tax=Bufo gargarizans TaxID=30331 RepID=UPI001CF5681A|nr:phospholipid scramblase 3-like [Bufo gargarizans]XP_044130741.1 phospholipid scramblase 3-like [Bufo gargarizans]XP_044130742.1 phospholipid scramblase 3-like [Bufo gargarizans]XP_044130743.1 phospholipid scramblase 3-like [Bufo gargarizans]XP_044130744.1 phospholipid scramblase 3-like [Bufo gargarizans]XP_044130745.1 phospholipid scramblase 3-like [Bufo gargarizans]XP_044130746.1 phospholipid scramblase 3-like [Bufo gargarizans]XP_044130747.1 phospholipid scramblase 3-like [Bufo gargariz
MTSTDTRPAHTKVSDEPPSYSLITPYAPPVTIPPSAPPSFQMDTAIVKGISPGMEHLLQVNQLMVKEKFSVSQGWGFSFEVLNLVGQRLFQAEQNVVCCGPLYDVRIRDNSNNEVLHLLENCGCTCTREMEVHGPSGQLIGFVKEHWKTVVTHLSLMNTSRQVTLIILGPSFQNSIFGNVSFEVKSPDEQHVVGMIKKETDHLLLTFPLDLEVTMKAMLLGSSLYLESLIKLKRTALQRRASN